MTGKQKEKGVNLGTDVPGRRSQTSFYGTTLYGIIKLQINVIFKKDDSVNQTKAGSLLIIFQSGSSRRLKPPDVACLYISSCRQATEGGN